MLKCWPLALIALLGCQNITPPEVALPSTPDLKVFEQLTDGITAIASTLTSLPAVLAKADALAQTAEGEAALAMDGVYTLLDQTGSILSEHVALPTNLAEVKTQFTHWDDERLAAIEAVQAAQTNLEDVLVSLEDLKAQSPLAERQPLEQLSQATAQLRDDLSSALQALGGQPALPAEGTSGLELPVN